MHIFKMRMLVLLRNKIVLFWTLIFPIAMATFFNFAFVNILKNEDFITIPIAIVENENLDNELVNLMESIKYGSNKLMYEVRLMDKNDALEKLNNETIIGIIEFDVESTILLKLKNGGIQATILKSFLDEYVQTTAAVESLSLISDNDINIIIADLFNNQNYLYEVETNTNPALVILIYFFSLLGMALIQGGFWGTVAMSDLQANLSARGMRVAISGKNKFSLLFIHLLSSFLIHITEILIFLLYMIFILKI
ncbi:MAG TPA: ABC transporter permease, partial [Acholeplasmataceae bacterium]|nr:ABC transporter permease [Acholeplasmataceae bacterium]